MYLPCVKIFTFLFWLGADRFLYVFCFPRLDGPEDLEELNADSRAYYLPREDFEFHGMATSDYFVLAFQKNSLQISRLFCGAQLLAMFTPLKK